VQLVAALGGLAFIVASLVVGLRILLLARRTRQLPELVIGLSLFLAGGLGYPMLVVARTAITWPDPVRIALFTVAMLFGLTGTLCAATFNQQVFRPGAAWARALVVALACTQVGLLLWQALDPGFAAGAFYNHGNGLRLFTASHGVPLAWASFESFRYGAQLARRVRLGLADPVVADRVRLWGISMGASLIINLAATVGALMGVDFATSTVGALVIAPLGLVAAASVFLAFLPPQAYLRRVTARAAGDAARA
jgi:hypothetical protein